MTLRVRVPPRLLLVWKRAEGTEASAVDGVHEFESHRFRFCLEGVL
jgi:hypothetical protein